MDRRSDGRNHHVERLIGVLARVSGITSPLYIADHLESPVMLGRACKTSLYIQYRAPDVSSESFLLHISRHVHSMSKQYAVHLMQEFARIVQVRCNSSKPLHAAQRRQEAVQFLGW